MATSFTCKIMWIVTQLHTENTFQFVYRRPGNTTHISSNSLFTSSFISFICFCFLCLLYSFVWIFCFTTNTSWACEPSIFASFVFLSLFRCDGVSLFAPFLYSLLHRHRHLLCTLRGVWMTDIRHAKIHFYTCSESVKFTRIQRRKEDETKNEQ